jgi:hypothetical protein
VEIDTGDTSLVSYILNHEDLVIVKGALELSAVQAFIKTKKVMYVQEHILAPLNVLLKEPASIQDTLLINEAYLKGALDMANEILTTIKLPGER